MRIPPGRGAGIAAVTSVAGWGSTRGSRQGASCKRTASRAIAPKGELALTTSEDGSGEGGIRTLEAGISPPNALAGRRLQPLGHFSKGAHRIAAFQTRKPAHGGLSHEAEGEGFEPSMHLSAHTRFP